MCLASYNDKRLCKARAKQSLTIEIAASATNSCNDAPFFCYCNDLKNHLRLLNINLFLILFINFLFKLLFI